MTMRRKQFRCARPLSFDRAMKPDYLYYVVALAAGGRVAALVVPRIQNYEN
jgi:hypothetical protein